MHNKTRNTANRNCRENVNSCRCLQSKTCITILLAAKMDGSPQLRPVILAFSKWQDASKTMFLCGIESCGWPTRDVAKWLENKTPSLQASKSRTLCLIVNCKPHPGDEVHAAKHYVEAAAFGPRVNLCILSTVQPKPTKKAAHKQSSQPSSTYLLKKRRTNSKTTLTKFCMGLQVLWLLQLV